MTEDNKQVPLNNDFPKKLYGNAPAENIYEVIPDFLLESTNFIQVCAGCFLMHKHVATCRQRCHTHPCNRLLILAYTVLYSTLIIIWG